MKIKRMAMFVSLSLALFFSFSIIQPVQAATATKDFKANWYMPKGTLVTYNANESKKLYDMVNDKSFAAKSKKTIDTISAIGNFVPGIGGQVISALTNSANFQFWYMKYGITQAYKEHSSYIQIFYYKLPDGTPGMYIYF